MNDIAYHKRISQSRGKRIIQLWIGIVLLSISALFWMILMIVIVAEPEKAGDVILSGLVLSKIPLGLGIYYVRCGKRKHKRKILYG